MTSRLACLLALGVAGAAGLASSASAGYPGASGAIVFQSGYRGNNAIDIWLRSASGKLTDLTNGAGANSDPAVSPDGTKIAFVSSRSGSDQVYVMSITGGRATQLTHDTKNDETPSWSPDGKQIVYVDGRVGHDEIAVMNANGSGAHLITHTDPLAYNEEPQWSPDGTKIVFSSNRPQQAIYTINPDGSGVTAIASTAVINTWPHWSPDSSRIVFDNLNDLMLVGAGGGAVTQLTHRGITTVAPAWSPDGSKIVFESRPTPAGNDDEFVLDVASGAVTQLTNDPADDRNADWASAGPLTSIAGCPAAATARMGRVQWNFAAAGEVKDATGLGLFDSGSHAAPYTFWSSISAAGLYAVSCGAGSSKVNVPVSVARTSSGLAVTWAAGTAPSGFVYDVQVKAPGSAFGVWQTGVTRPTARYKPAKPGAYAFQARLRRSSDGAATGWSLPVSIAVKGKR